MKCNVMGHTWVTKDAHVQDDLNLIILSMFEDTFSFGMAHIYTLFLGHNSLPYFS